MTSLRSVTVKVVLIFLLSVIYAPNSYAQPWWDCNWGFRTELSISSNVPQTQKTVHISLDASDFNTAYVFTPDGADLRVWDATHSTALPFHIEYWDSVAKEVIVNVKLPAISASASSIYLYYGNTLSTGASAVSTLSDAEAAFSTSGWRYHTRKSDLNPSSEDQARSVFEQLTDSNSGYGCLISGSVNGRNNRNTFNGPAGSYGLFIETHFKVTTPGRWRFRAGMDFGRGGGLYINDRMLDENWNTDLWWSQRYSNSDVLSGSVELNAGYHHIEVFGFEGCCDGPIGVQYRPPGSSQWLNLDSNSLSLLNPDCPVGSIADAYITTETAPKYSGVVFLDNDTQGGAHDGVKNDTETALGNIEITVTTLSTGLSSTSTTDANGNWTDCIGSNDITNGVSISSAPGSSYLNVSEGIPTQNTNSDLNSIIELIPQLDLSYTGLNFGYVELPVLSSSRTASVGAGETKTLPHIYTATSSAQVSFDISEQTHQSAFDFNYRTLRDQNCNGVIDADDSPLNNPIIVSAGDNICFLLEIEGNPTVVQDSLLELKIDALTEFTGVDKTAINTNLDNIVGQIPMQIVLLKEVCNASKNNCDIISGQGFSATATGAPNEELIYRMRFSSEKAALNDVVVSDIVPTFTTMKPNSAQISAEPSGVTCAVTQPQNLNETQYTGNIEWSCDGTIQPAQSGIVSFAVIVD